MKQAHERQITYVCDVVGCQESMRTNESYGIPYDWLEVEWRPYSGPNETLHYCGRHAKEIKNVSLGTPPAKAGSALPAGRSWS